MRIVVLVKMTRVIRGNPYRVDNLDELLNEKNLALAVNSYDLAALEEAQQLKGICGDVHITAVTAGPPYAVKALRVAHGMGADELIWVDTPPLEGGREMELARLLAQTVSRRGFDLVLCGIKSDDIGTGLVGVGMAGLLGVPAVTRAVDIKLQTGNGLLRVERHVGKGNREVVQCPLPAVVTVERSRQAPRYPGVARYLAAGKRIIKDEHYDRVEWQPVAPVTCLEIKKAQPRPKKIFTPDESLSGADRMKLIMGGGMARKKKKKKASGEVSGSEQLYNFLLKHGFIEK